MVERLRERGEAVAENRNGGNTFRSYQGKSWLGILGDPNGEHHDSIFASHTFHEITMYYPMRVVRDKKYKLIWNIAHQLDYPFASDLWQASSWQSQFRQGEDQGYGVRSVGDYLHRPEFELYDMQADPHESNNLALAETHRETLIRYQEKMKSQQEQLDDPWILKWDYE